MFWFMRGSASADSIRGTRCCAAPISSCVDAANAPVCIPLCTRVVNVQGVPYYNEVMKFTRRLFLHNFLALTGTAAAGLIYATKIEPYWVDFSRRLLPIPNLPAGLEGSTLIHLSDLHIGARFDYQYILDTLQELSVLEPDFVVYTGDFISYETDYQLDQFAAVAPLLLHGRRGTAAILGNHDYGHGWQQTAVADTITAQLVTNGVDVLRNEMQTMAGLTLIGLDDYWSPCYDPQRVLSRVDPQGANLTLVHNPDVVDEDVWCGYRGWILAGHTHGGQVKPPFLPPPVLPVRNKRYTAGFFDLGDGRSLYINRALGHLWSVRFNSRPEVGIFTLSQVQ